MHWIQKQFLDSSRVVILQDELSVSETIAKLLVQRGIDSFDIAKNFFRPQLSALHDPFEMQDMLVAVERVQKAIKSQETVMIYGDYDVDGTTSVALVYSYLKNYLESLHPYIPDRYSEGYGISFQGIDRAKKDGVSLIIALDCGIKAIDKVAYANRLGIDFIICDHHLPSEKLPEAIAVLDPKRSDCLYPYKELCGCGIGFKLIQALTQTAQRPFESLLPYLDLVATAIAADIVPITGENRILMHFGIKQLQSAPRVGFQFFLKQLKKEVRVSDLVFIIAPRINAAGRMKHGLFAVQLLIAETAADAMPLARSIELYNTERKSTDERITAAALEQLENNKETDRFSTVVFDPEWHKGVVGIVASRLIEKYYRPTVVLTQSGEVLTGSVRSVVGFNVYEALEACQEHMIQFGGHKYAAGLTLKKEDYKSFKAAFEEVVAQRILPEQRVPAFYYDLEIDFKAVTEKLFRIINQMGPFGPQNMQPVFKTSQCLDSGGSRAVGKDQSHLRLEVEDPSGIRFVGIAFGMAHHLTKIKSRVPFSILYTLDENEFNGRVSLQLKVKDFAFDQ